MSISEVSRFYFKQNQCKSDTFVTFQFLDHLKIINVALSICQIILKYSVIFLHLDLYFKLKCAKIKEEK